MKTVTVNLGDEEYEALQVILQKSMNEGETIDSLINECVLFYLKALTFNILLRRQQ